MMVKRKLTLKAKPNVKPRTFGTFTPAVDLLYTHDLVEGGEATRCGIKAKHVPQDVEFRISCDCGECQPATCPACRMRH